MPDPPTPINLDAARTAVREGTGRGVRVAILDSGVELAHPDLVGLQLTDDVAVVQSGMTLEVRPGEGRDVFGHGTAIAGIIRSLAPEAEIGSIRVLGDHLLCRTEIICEGARQAFDRGYHVLNCSFGCTRAGDVLRYKSWVDSAYLRGRHIVAAASNVDTSQVEWPGHFSSVITVCTTNTAHPYEWCRLVDNLVEFAARGADVEVSWKDGGRKTVTGTSYAAPHVTGIVARMLSIYPDLTPHEVKALLRRLARPQP